MSVSWGEGRGFFLFVHTLIGCAMVGTRTGRMRYGGPWQKSCCGHGGTGCVLCVESKCTELCICIL